MTTYASEFERFAIESQARHVLCQLGKGDKRPGQPWSMGLNDSSFLNSLQQVKADEWMTDDNRIFWQFLHIGGELPN